MVALPYLVYQALQGSIRRWLTQNEPGEQILIFFFQQSPVQGLPLRVEILQALLNKRQKQQIQLPHAASAVPRKFLVLNI